ncbi:hypothetical protein RGQ15_10315 [Paracoccus sp. MBLB3053]|uniref:Helix-turn-helix domain-containing protein n=1 Tax=Paracoccus aurantius TaxID=3073814 RepID=A0ABU2HSD3_9RHOB|nr:hypothetical protein [Paracoccus sp. MBLB3053]MDS9467958.1 hypothetical protein [Paracoccus sp. MBLB3053]
MNEELTGWPKEGSCSSLSKSEKAKVDRTSNRIELMLLKPPARTDAEAVSAEIARLNALAGRKWLRSKEAAEFLGKQTDDQLRKWRRIGGKGPPFVKKHGRIEYPLDLLVKWREENQDE